MNNKAQSVTQRLEQFIATHLPLVNSMGLEIEHYDEYCDEENSFVVSAPLNKNHNDKLTAFGGSLYNLCITNAIGLCFLKCYEQGILEPDLVVAKAEIEYLKPVSTEKIVAMCESPKPEKWQHFFEKYQYEKKAVISLHSEIIVDGEICVRFSGRFAIIGQDRTVHQPA